MRTKFAVLMGLSVLIVCAATASPVPPANTPASSSDYYTDVQPMVATHCISCHREGTGAPFSLETARDVEKRAPQIAQAVSSGLMPPWKPDSHGELMDENRLSGPQIATIQQWANAGAPMGEVRSKLLAETVANGLGKPDAVLSPLQPVSIPADGPGFYQCFILPTHFAAHKYLSAIVFQPSNPNVADHAIEYMDAQRRIRLMNSVSSGDGFVVSRSTTGLWPSMVIGGWGICTTPRRFPTGDGLLLTSGADIVLEVHYHSTGKPEQDLPSLQLYFCKGPVHHQIRVAPVAASQLRLGTRRKMPNMAISGQRPLVAGISIVDVFPYMRAQGHSIKLSILRPDKSQSPLFSIPTWDFAWIGDYRFKTPVRVPVGSLLLMTADFGSMPSDSRDAICNRKLTTWGDALDDENAVVYVFYTTDRENLDRRLPAAGIPDLGGANDAAITRILLHMFDVNKDGRIDGQEQQAMRTIFGPNLPHLAGMDLM